MQHSWDEPAHLTVERRDTQDRTHHVQGVVFSRLQEQAPGMRASPSAEQLLPWLGKEMGPVVLVCHPPGLREAYSHTSWS